MKFLIELRRGKFANVCDENESALIDGSLIDALNKLQELVNNCHNWTAIKEYKITRLGNY